MIFTKKIRKIGNFVYGFSEMSTRKIGSKPFKNIFRETNGMFLRLTNLWSIVSKVFQRSTRITPLTKPLLKAEVRAFSFRKHKQWSVE